MHILICRRRDETYLTLVKFNVYAVFAETIMEKLCIDKCRTVLFISICFSWSQFVNERWSTWFFFKEWSSSKVVQLSYCKFILWLHKNCQIRFRMLLMTSQIKLIYLKISFIYLHGHHSGVFKIKIRWILKKSYL